MDELLKHGFSVNKLCNYCDDYGRKHIEHDV